ncbi:MAG: hypothetical protein LBK74_10295 [Treponema sp.]|nr:hypothetical protein [Treponema sp.]
MEQPERPAARRSGIFGGPASYRKGRGRGRGTHAGFGIPGNGRDLWRSRLLQDYEKTVVHTDNRIPLALHL